MKVGVKPKNKKELLAGATPITKPFNKNSIANIPPREESPVANIRKMVEARMLAEENEKIRNKEYKENLSNKEYTGSLYNNIKMLDEQVKQIKTINEKTLEEIKGLKIDNDNKQAMYDLAKKQAAQSIAESISKVALNNAEKILTNAKTITEEKVREEIEERSNLLKKQALEIEQKSIVTGKQIGRAHV